MHLVSSLVERKSYRQILCLGVVIDLSTIAQVYVLKDLDGILIIGIGSTLEILPYYAIFILFFWENSNLNMIFHGN